MMTSPRTGNSGPLTLRASGNPVASRALRVLVVDDEPLARERMRQTLSARQGIESLFAADGEEAVAIIQRDRPDVVFLDIQMPRLDGFGVIRAVGVERMPVVVFVTAFGDHALRAFDTHALDYVVKPYEKERVLAALDRANRRVLERDLGAAAAALAGLSAVVGVGEPRTTTASERNASDSTQAHAAVSGPLERIAVRLGGRIRVLDVRDVDWIEADGVNARLHAGTETHLVRMTMHALEARLDPNRFVRVHRSAMVNLERVRELRETSRGEFVIVLASGTRVKLSRLRKDALARRLGQSI